MKGYIFFKKEISEWIRTPKAMVLVLIFLFFGILNPLGARYINEIIQSTGQLGDFKLPNPTWTDAFVQFYKNNHSICFIALILTFMNVVTGEKRSGTAVLMLSKGITRSSFIYSKYIAGVLIYLAAYVANASMTVLYSYFLFDNFTPDKLLVSLSIFGLSGILFLAVATLASVLASDTTTAAILSVGGYILINILEIIPGMKRLLPGRLVEVSFDLMKGNGWIEGSFITIFSTILISAILLQISVIIFRRQEF